MKLQSLLPALITAAFLSTTFGGVVYADGLEASDYGDVLAKNKYYKVIATPGETAGPRARPPIKHNLNFQNPRNRRVSKMRSKCEQVLRNTVAKACSTAAVSTIKCNHEYGALGWDSSNAIRYVQLAGAYCYYYKAGSSSGAGGKSLWRYDTQKCEYDSCDK